MKTYCLLYLLYICRNLSTKSKNRKLPEPPNNEDEDEDVKAERLKVKELMGCQCCEEVIYSLWLSHSKYEMINSRYIEINLKNIFLCIWSNLKKIFLGKKYFVYLLLNKPEFQSLMDIYLYSIPLLANIIFVIWIWGMCSLSFHDKFYNFLFKYNFSY